MAKNAKVLAIGLDSADRDLIWEMQEAGELPVIHALVQKGIWGTLKSPPGIGDDGVWASFSHSMPPGRHGRFFWRTLLPGSYQTPLSADHQVEADTFWHALSTQGFKVGVMDVPKSPLSKVKNGFQLSDWLVHGRDKLTRSWPPEIAEQVLSQFGDDRIDRYGTEDFLCRDDALPPELHEEFLNRLNAGLECKRDASAQFLADGGWDFFLTVFKECHCVGHEFWHLMDERHCRHTEPVNPLVGKPVKDIYRSLDTAIGELLKLTDEETTVLLFSGLGMRSNYTGEHLLAEALVRLEAQAPKSLTDHYSAQSSSSRGCARQVPHNELSGAIRVNIRGREPEGTVPPGETLEKWYEWIETALLELVDPDSGQHVVEEIIRTDVVYPGEMRDRLPDLFVVWKRDFPITGLASSRIGEIREDPLPLRSGNHIADGFYLLSGPETGAPRQGEQASVMDLGPTIAFLLGGALPHCDGTSILKGKH